MLHFGFYYYVIVCLFAISLNVFIILASTRPYIRGEFKWVFLSLSITNLLLSISELVVMPSLLKWPRRNEVAVIMTNNPLLSGQSHAWCETLYDFLYFRQWEAAVLSICIVPLSRAITVCWKSIAPANARHWVFIAIVPNVLPSLATMIGKHLGLTNGIEVSATTQIAITSDSLKNRINSDNYCTLKSNYGKPGDIFMTVFLVFCPAASYSITIFCIVKLYLFIRKSKGSSMRPTISKQVMQRQKSILVTICIQAVVPVLTYMPLFVSIVLIDNPWRISAGDAEWYETSVVHYIAAWGPALDAAATVACLKPYRRAFMELFNFATARSSETRATAFMKTTARATSYNMFHQNQDSITVAPMEREKRGRGIRTLRISSVQNEHPVAGVVGDIRSTCYWKKNRDKVRHSVSAPEIVL